jgi:alpha-D-ribose 1-methylphosphonate 5-triphosphate diphosphatase
VQAVFALHQRHGYTLPDAVAAASALPAQAANLSDRGELAVGKRADLVQVSMHGAFPVIRAVWRGGKRIA